MAVLIVDDSRVMRQVQRKVVSELGVEHIIEAQDGVSALYQLRDHQFAVDLILTDWMMPRMDGLALVKILKGHAELKKIPVLMVTSRAEEKRMREALQAGVNGYLIKPFSEEMLINSIRSLAGGPVEPAAKSPASRPESFLRELTPQAHQELLAAADVIAVASDERVLPRGEVVEDFVVVLEGQVSERIIDTLGRSQISHRLGPGDCVGVTELMTGEPLASDVVAVTDSELAFVPRNAFESMLMNSAEMSLTLSRYLASRAREISLEAQERASDVSRALTGNTAILELSDLIQALNLRQATGIIDLPDIGATLEMSRGQVVAAQHPDGVGEDAFLRILQEEPKAFRFRSVPPALAENIEKATTRLLLDTMRQLDEAKAARVPVRT